MAISLKPQHLSRYRQIAWLFAKYGRSDLVKQSGLAETLDQMLAVLGSQVEDSLRASGWAEVPAHEVGLAILGPLRELDEVAYLRFASVYRSFESADDFETEIALMRAEHSPTGEEPSYGDAPPPRPR